MGLENPLHLAFLAILLLLVFGAKRLPELGRSLGSGMRGFKESISGESRDEHDELPAPVENPMTTPPVAHTVTTPAVPVAGAPTAPTAVPAEPVAGVGTPPRAA